MPNYLIAQMILLLNAIGTIILKPVLELRPHILYVCMLQNAC